MKPFGLILLNLDTSSVFNSDIADTLKSTLIEEPAITPFSYIKVIFMLALVLAVILVSVWLLKKVTPQFSRSANSGLIKILSTFWLGPKKALYLIQVAGKILLVGVTDHNINIISEFSDPDEAHNVLTSLEGKKSEPNFANLLSSLFNKNRES